MKSKQANTSAKKGLVAGFQDSLFTRIFGRFFQLNVAEEHNLAMHIVLGIFVMYPIKNQNFSG